MEYDSKSDSLYTVRLQTLKNTWRNAVALSWSKTGETPVPVRFQEKGDVWIFTAGGRTVTLDWKTGAAQLKP
jgi:hypothetical protein